MVSEIARKNLGRGDPENTVIRNGCGGRNAAAIVDVIVASRDESGAGPSWRLTKKYKPPATESTRAAATTESQCAIDVSDDT
jgi:hypothetical protein